MNSGGINGTNAMGTGGYGSAAQTVSRELGKNEFMKILAAELQNQDPTNPMDNKDFIAQLAQFSSLEQMNQMAESFTGLDKKLGYYLQMQSDISGSLLIMQSAALIGKNAVAIIDGTEIEGEITAIRMDKDLPLVVIGENLVPVSSIIDIRQNSKTGE